MAYNDRSNKIVKYLKENHKATVEELAAYFYVSEATIRRDLTELNKLGQVKRTHGGAVFTDDTDEISIFVRKTKNAKEKEQTAFIALKHLTALDFHTVFFDNSSTSLALAERMDLAHKTVVTNGLQIAMSVFKQDSVNPIIPGGELLYNTSAVLGSLTTSMINSFNFDLSITSCSAIDAGGTYELSLESMQIKKTAFARSKKRVLLADSTKLSTNAAFKSAELKDYDLIITDASDEDLKKLCLGGELPANIFNK